MQGLFITSSRPKSKKQIREHLAAGRADDIYVQATSHFGKEYDGYLDQAPVGTKIDFVGPDPYTNRKFYGRLTVTDKGVKLT